MTAATPLQTARAVSAIFDRPRNMKTQINGYQVTRIFPSGYLSVTCSHCGDMLKSDGNVKDLRSFVANHCTKKGTK